MTTTRRRKPSRYDAAELAKQRLKDRPMVRCACGALVFEDELKDHVCEPPTSLRSNFHTFPGGARARASTKRGGAL